MSFEKIETLLRVSGLLPIPEDKKTLLLEIAKEVEKQGLLDRDTRIYRMAMSIYHSSRFVGESLFGQVEDAVAAYLNIKKDRELFELIQSEARKTPGVPLDEIVKTLLCFAIASYIYSLIERG